MKSINPNTVPIGITNAVQAFALDLAGIPMDTQPCVNLYSSEILFALGGGKKDDHGNVTRPSRYAGMILEDAALKAFEEGEPGSVHYRFQRSQELGELCKSFSDQEAKIKLGMTVNTTKTIQEIIDALTAGTMERGEATVRLVCTIVKMYVTFKRQWEQVAPLIKIPNPGKTASTPTPGGGRIDSSPGFRVVSLNASPKLRKKAGLKT